jgi:hypothetical protein
MKVQIVYAPIARRRNAYTAPKTKTKKGARMSTDGQDCLIYGRETHETRPESLG